MTVRDRAARGAQHAWRHDPSLPLPAPPPRAARPLPFELGSALPDAASSEPFVVRGRNAMVDGRLDRPALEIRCNGAHAVSALKVVGATVQATRVTTIGTERVLRVNDRAIVERVFVPATGSAAVLEWSDVLRPHAAPSDALTLEWSLPAMETGDFAEDAVDVSRWHASDWALVAVGGGTAIAVAAPDALALTIRPENGSVRCAATLASGAGPIRLFLAAATDVPNVLDAVERAYPADALARARAARVRRILREHVAARTDQPDVNRAFEWAGLRVDEDAARLTAVDSGDEPAAATAAIVALASLAAGDADPAEHLLGTWASDVHRSAHDAALHLFLAAWHSRWTGDAAGFTSHLAALRRAAEQVARQLRDPLGTVAVAEIARAAEAAAPPFAAEARAILAGLASPDEPGGAAGTRLATLGTPRAPGQAAGAAEPDPWPSFLHAIEALPGGTCAAVAAWRGIVATPLTGLTLWQDALLAGLKHYNALWDHDMDPAILILGWVHGVLGAEPDAARHRLRMRPYLPQDRASWSFGELRIADARVGATFERDGGRAVVRVEQTAGAFPLTLIMELVVPDAEAGDVAIDGRPASLDLRPVVGGTVVPVQLVLDDRREIVVDVRGRTDKKAAPGERGRR